MFRKLHSVAQITQRSFYNRHSSENRGASLDLSYYTSWPVVKDQCTTQGLHNETNKLVKCKIPEIQADICLSADVQR